MKRALRSIISVVLVLALCVSTLSVVAFAEDPIVYLALGDSTAQGYLLPDYQDGCSGLQFPENETYSYPYMFRDYLKKTEKREVTMYQYTIQGMRPNELYAILDPNGARDTADAFCDQHIGWYKDAFDKRMGKTNLTQAYADAIVDADIITYDLSMNNFGTYFTDRLRTFLGDPDQYKDFYADYFEEKIAPQMEPGAAQLVLSLKNGLIGLLTDALESSDPTTAAMANELIEAALYSYGSFALYFDKTVEIIYGINPDAELIVFGTYNAMRGLNAVIGENKIDFGVAMQLVYNAINSYITSISPRCSTYKYVDLTGGVETYIDEIAGYVDENGEPDLELFNENEFTKNTRQKLIQGIFEMMGSQLEPMTQNVVNKAYDSDYPGYTNDLDERHVELIRNQTDPILVAFIKAANCMDVDIVSLFEALGDEAKQAELVGEALADFDAASPAAKGLLHIALRFLFIRGFGTHPSAHGYEQKFAALKLAHASTISANGTSLLKTGASIFTALLEFLRGLFRPSEGQIGLFEGIGRALKTIFGINW